MKNIKRILAIVFCLIICFSLCSCNYIDELRSKQAFYDESGNITFRDEVYQVSVFCVDSSIAADDNQTYIQKRLHREITSQETTPSGDLFFCSEGITPSTHKNCVISFMDSEHYYLIKTSASVEELKDFVELLNFEKVFLINNTEL